MNLRFLIVLLASAGLLAGCGSDCRTYCQRYQECVDAKTVVDDCTSACENRNTNNPDHQNRAKLCATCLDGKTCSQATSQCFTECIAL